MLDPEFHRVLTNIDLIQKIPAQIVSSNIFVYLENT